ncbi:unnamed protein product [Sphacelaria rigidula]
MLQSFGRRRGKTPARAGGGDRNVRGNTQRALDGNLDFMDGMIMGTGDKGGAGEKQLSHKEWTKEPFPDDFDDDDLE